MTTPAARSNPAPMWIFITKVPSRHLHNGSDSAELQPSASISVYFPAMRYLLLAVFAMAAAILLTITFGHAQQRAPQPAAATPQRGQQAAPAAQRGQQQPYQINREARLYGRPNLNGIWQAMNSANWNLEAHNAEALNDFWRLGAIAAIPAGRSVIREGTIPYLPEAL